jgi:hypothetical protein
MHIRKPRRVCWYLTDYASLFLHQLYLLKDSARRLDLSFPEAEAMVATLNAVKNKEHKGMTLIPRSTPPNTNITDSNTAFILLCHRPLSPGEGQANHDPRTAGSDRAGVL